MNLNQVTIYTDKVLETVEFYKKLGLFLIVDSLPRYARLEFPDGDATLSVNEFSGDMPPATGSNNVVLYFDCEDLDADHERLTAAGIAFVEPTTDRPWLWREAYIADPNGNKICLFQAGENRKNPPWRIRCR